MISDENNYSTIGHTQLPKKNDNLISFPSQVHKELSLSPIELSKNVNKEFVTMQNNTEQTSEDKLVNLSIAEDLEKGNPKIRMGAGDKSGENTNIQRSEDLSNERSNTEYEKLLLGEQPTPPLN